MYQLNIKASIKIVVCLFLLVSLVSVAQTTNDSNKFLPNIIPPSPVSYDLGKYGNQPVGMFTGATNINIPLYTYKSSNIEVPISLFYTNDGIKVDNTSGQVGLGWGINMGGVINRVIRDRKDDLGTLFPNEKVLEAGINPEKYQFYQKIGYPDADSEPDLFSFNFNGYSGQFVYDNEGEIVMLKANNIKVEYLNLDSSFGFMVTTPDGVQYYFFATETTLPTGGTGGGSGGTNASVTSWYLTKIKHPKGDEVYLAYQNYDYQYISSKSQSLIVPTGYFDLNCQDASFVKGSIRLQNIADSYLEIFGKKLSQITSNNPKNGSITFTYDTTDPDITGLNKLSQINVKNDQGIDVEKFSFNYTTTTNKRTFLKEIAYLDTNKKYSFEYIDESIFPTRLSFSQDLFGYYNGKSNSVIIPSGLRGYGLENISYGGADRSIVTANAQQGMLSKIVYPTKGYTKIEYESNSYFGEKTTYPSITSSRAETVLPGNEFGYREIDSPILQDVKVTGRASFNDSCSPSMNTGHNSASFQVLDMQTNQMVNLYQLTSDGLESSLGTSVTITTSISTFYFHAEAGKKYKGIVQLNAPCTKAYCDMAYYATAPTTVNTDIITGGVRVQRQNDYNFDNSVENKKTYFYTNTTDPASRRSSGKLMMTKPYFGDVVTTRGGCDVAGLFNEKKDWIVTSSSFIVLFNEQGNNVAYEKVIESFGGDNYENGAVEHQYRINKNSPGNLLSGTDIQSSPAVNDGWDHGNELVTITYAKPQSSLVRVNEKSYLYNLDSRSSKVITAFSARKNFDLFLAGDAVHYCQASEIGKTYFSGYNCTASHSHVLWIPSGKCIASGNNNVRQYLNNPCYSGPVGAVVYYPNHIENLSIKSYTIKSNWSYLKSMTEIQYGLNESNPVTNVTDYTYNNVEHLQLSVQSTKNSKKETVETRYFYPEDSAMSGLSFVNDLKTANMVEIPLDTQVFKAGSKLSEQLTVYEKSAATSNILLPKSIYAAKFPNSFTAVLDNRNIEKKVTYDKYDDRGNIQQYTLENNIPVSIIWGYGRTQPIAKLENVAYASISASTISNLQTLSDADNDNCMSGSCTEQLLRNALDALRGTFPNAFISTYTYNPLVGVTSVTDVKGIPSYYEYDSFGRLKFVKDKDLNVLQKYCYNYKGQQVNCSDNTSTSIVSYKSIARSGSFTRDNCATGGTAQSLPYNQAAGAVISTVSQSQADAEGLSKFNTDGQAYVNTNAKCIFSSAAKSGVFTRNNCAAGGAPQSATYSVPAGRFTSDVSQAAADALAQNDVNSNGQAYANTNAKCIFTSAAKSGVFTRNNCAAGGAPQSVTYSVPAGRYTSDVSQATADGLAQNDVNVNGQAYANDNNNAKCIFSSVAKSGVFTRNNCAAGGTPQSLTYTVPAGRYTSDVSQATADALAQNDVNANGQTYVNTNAKCIFSSVAKSGVFTRNNCAAGGTPQSVTYSVPAGRYTSDVSQATADALAQNDVNANGQSYANNDNNAKCTFKNQQIIHQVYKNDYCPPGTTYPYVYYYVYAGTYQSTISQADADNKAWADVAANAQAYANANGRCLNPGELEE